MSVDQDKQMLFFDLSLKSDSWFALIFGNDLQKKHDMIMWDTQIDMINSAAQNTTVVSASTHDAIWYGYDRQV